MQFYTGVDTWRAATASNASTSARVVGAANRYRSLSAATSGSDRLPTVSLGVDDIRVKEAARGSTRDAEATPLWRSDDI